MPIIGTESLLSRSAAIPSPRSPMNPSASASHYNLKASIPSNPLHQKIPTPHALAFAKPRISKTCNNHAPFTFHRNLNLFPGGSNNDRRTNVLLPRRLGIQPGHSLPRSIVWSSKRMLRIFRHLSGQCPLSRPDGQ